MLTAATQAPATSLPDLDLIPAALRRAAWLALLPLVAGCATARDDPSARATAPPAGATTPASAPGEDGSAATAADGRPGEEAASPRVPGTRGPNYAFDIEAPQSLVDDIRRQTLAGRWQRREDYDPIQFDGLVARLQEEVEAILRAQGYFRGKASVTSSQGRVRVVVEAGPQATVAGVDLRITGAARDDRETMGLIRGIPGLEPGRPFLASAWQSGKREIVDILNRQGYLRAEVASSEARIDVPKASAALQLEVASGPRIAFGELEIQGLQRYDRRIVEDLRPFTPGEPYSDAKMQTFQLRLRGAGYFSSVSALPDLLALQADPDAERVRIQVTVGEVERRRVVLGLGYSTDEGVRGQVGFEHRDLLGRNLQLESALVMSTKRQTAFANFRTPHDENGNYIGFGQRFEREDIENQVTVRGNTYAGIGKREGDIDSFTSLQYQVENEKIILGGGQPDERNSHKALVLGKAWNLRRVDSTIDPRDGYSVSAQFSGAREGIITDRSFVRLHTRATRFQPLPGSGFFKDDMLVGLLEFGAVGASSREDIPSDNLFRAGGTQSIRGYPYESLGVKRGDAVVGGRYLAVVSLEYQHRITAAYSAAAFVDYGNAGDSWAEFDPVAGYGVGLRWRTPIGPVNLDVAYGQALSRFRMHFSIGYTF